MTYKILCCDGGGIRGLVTILLIQDLVKIREDFLDKANGFAGTSTGGVVALGLAKGVNLEDILNVYKNQGKEIFTQNTAIKKRGEKGKSALIKRRGLGVCKYSSVGLEKVATRLLQNSKLSDSRKMIAINTVQLWDGKSWQPRTLSNLGKNSFRNMSMVDALLATSAAPTFLPPHEIKKFGYFVDGGLFANNPSMSAVCEALGSGTVDKLSDIRVLSLGTGRNPQGIPPQVLNDKGYKPGHPLRWGALNWLWPKSWPKSKRLSAKVPPQALINLLLDCTSDNTTKEASKLLGDAYCRANVPLKQPYDLDDYAIKDIQGLEMLTRRYMKTKAWQNVRNWVSQNWS